MGICKWPFGPVCPVKSFLIKLWVELSWLQQSTCTSNYLHLYDRQERGPTFKTGSRDRAPPPPQGAVHLSYASTCYGRVDLRTRFKVSSFIRSRNRRGSPIWKLGRVTLTTLPQGAVYICINLIISKELRFHDSIYVRTMMKLVYILLAAVLLQLI